MKHTYIISFNINLSRFEANCKI